MRRTQRSRNYGHDPLPYGPGHPVARMIADGDNWFRAWAYQAAMPWATIARRSGVPVARLHHIESGDALTREELEALAGALRVRVDNMIASLPDPALLFEGLPEGPR